MTKSGVIITQDSGKSEELHPVFDEDGKRVGTCAVSFDRENGRVSFSITELTEEGRELMTASRLPMEYSVGFDGGPSK